MKKWTRWSVIVVAVLLAAITGFNRWQMRSVGEVTGIYRQGNSAEITELFVIPIFGKRIYVESYHPLVALTLPSGKDVTIRCNKADQAKAWGIPYGQPITVHNRPGSGYLEFSH